MRKSSPGRKKSPIPKLKPINEIAKSIGINKKFLEHYGPYKAKISLDILKSLKSKKTGKYILVTSVTPPFFGTGKTVTAIGLSMALKRLNKKAMACLMQPALSGVFGTKETATSKGLSQVFPTNDANLYLTGDNHAIESAQNLCAAYLDNSIFNGNPRNIAPDSIVWKRVIDADDRSLRNVSTGMGVKADGISRRTGFTTPASSELMAILSLAESVKDLRLRIGKIILGFTEKGKTITCEDINAAGAMTALLKDAIKPTLLQTTEHTACLMHTGSDRIGTGSIIADRIALGLCDYVIAKTAFGVDMGAEKFFNIKCRASRLKPDAAVLVCSTRVFKIHSGDFEINDRKLPREILRENISAIERGLSNLQKQIENLRVFNIPIIVCINRFAEDTDKEIMAIEKRVKDWGVTAIVTSDVYAIGGEGGMELAKAVIEACKIKHDFRFLYPVDMPIKDKIKRIAVAIYGAKKVIFSDEANKKAMMFKKAKVDRLPVCIIKTPFSLSHNPKKIGRPHGFKFPIEDIQICNGAGYITALSSDINTIPELPKVPRGAKIDVDEEGKIVGL